MKIGLGTVQFGLDYGISNMNGRTPESEVRNILDLAGQAGIRVLDTASLYGDSEAVLGRTLPAGERFSIVTKTPKFDGDLIRHEQAEQLEMTFHQSLRRLNRPQVYGLMIHRARDLLVEGGERLYDRMRSLKDRGLVRNLGVSVYDAHEIDELLGKYQLDLIQVPVNVFDQRLIRSGHLGRLKQAGIEVHARSAFLQGVLLMAPESLPSYFEGVRAHSRRYSDFVAREGLTPLQASLGYVQSLPEVDVVICGVNNGIQLQEICRAAETRVDPLRFSGFYVSDETIVNPSLWKH